MRLCQHLNFISTLTNSYTHMLTRSIMLLLEAIPNSEIKSEKKKLFYHFCAISWEFFFYKTTKSAHSSAVKFKHDVAIHTIKLKRS